MRPRPTRLDRICAVCLMAASLFAPPAFAGEHFITATFGNTDRCEFKGTLKGDKGAIQFDLSALGGAKVYRAILKVAGGNHQTGAPVTVTAEGLPDAKPLALLPPYFASLDATAAVKAWTAKPDSNKGFAIASSGGLDFTKAVLEVSFAGTAKEPIPAVTELKAIHQAGQTFLTWKEIEDVVGDDAPKFEDFEKKVLDARAKRSVSYRVYRSDKPITLAALGEAQMMREIQDAVTCWNLKAIQVTEHPNQGTPTKGSPLRPGYNLAKAYLMTRYRIVDKGEPLSRATGLSVLTVAKPAKSYYAVTASIDGREAATVLGDGATLKEPVDEAVSQFPAIVYQRSSEAGKDPRSPGVDVYNSWLEAPYNNIPIESETYIVRWKDLPQASADKRLPLFVTTGTYGCTASELASPGWHGARRLVDGAFTIGLTEGSLWQGFHEGHGTWIGWDQGAVHNYPQRRVLGSTHWAIQKPDFFIDPERVCIWGQLAGWALRYGDLYSAVLSNGYGNFAIGKEAQKHGPQWGPYPRSTKNWLGIDQWEYMDLPKWIRDNPTAELPYWLCAPAYGGYPNHEVGDFGFMPWPEMVHAMHSTKRAFAANWSSNGPGPVGPLHALVTRIKLHQSLPAFTNCSLDHSIGDGDHDDAEKGGGMNLYQVWEPETLVDETDKWEITLDLRKDCPVDALTTDLTPRRCQKFKAKPGDKFKWTNTDLKENKPVQSGEATADKWGLVTLEKLTIGRGKNRVVIGKQ